MTTVVPTPELLLDAPDAGSAVEVGVHDASRLAWDVAVPIASRSTSYVFELEFEIPSNVFASQDPWSQLQSYARLDTPQGPEKTVDLSADAIRRTVLMTSAKLLRARDGFARHCALVRASGDTTGEEGRALALWIEAGRAALAQTRQELERRASDTTDRLSEGSRASVTQERGLADEYLSAQFWTVLTDCSRSLTDVRRVFDDYPECVCDVFDEVEAAIVSALAEEIAHRRAARFPHAEPVNARQLEQFLHRSHWLKRHFQRVLFLEGQTFQISQHLQSWFSAAAAVIAYLWFFLWQLALEHRRGGAPTAIGSGVVAFALITAIVYASREKLKEAGRNWIAGRVQRFYAQRIARYRAPRNGKRAGHLFVSARESFSQSTAERPDPVDPKSGSTVQVHVVRFSHRGTLTPPGATDAPRATQLRNVFRYDMSPLFPRLHDAVKGLAMPDIDTGRVVITDVPRNYEVPIRASLRVGAQTSSCNGVLVLNKNGLLRFERSAQAGE